MEVHREQAEPWRVTLVDTGDDTMTGGRLKRVRTLRQGRRRLLLHLWRRRRRCRHPAAIDFHRARQAGDGHRRAAARAAIGALELDGDAVIGFHGKAPRRWRLDQRRLFRAVAEVSSTIIEGDHSSWEPDRLSQSGARRQLMPIGTTASGKPWTPCATRTCSKNSGNRGKAPWKVWDESSFWRGKRVLVTGHTGFKGAGSRCGCRRMGAEVTGVALPPDTSPTLFEQLGLARSWTTGIARHSRC